MRTERHKSAIGCVCAVPDDRQFASCCSFLYILDLQEISYLHT